MGRSTPGANEFIQEVEAPSQAGWKAVRSGLRLFQISAIIQIGLVVGGLLVMLSIVAWNLAQSGTPPAPGTRPAPGPLGVTIMPLGLAILGTLAFLTIAVLDLIGAIYLVQVPPRTGCKAFAIILLVCTSVVLASPLLGIMGSAVRSSGLQSPFQLSGSGAVPSGLRSPLQLLGNATALGASIMLLICLFKIGGYLQWRLGSAKGWYGMRSRWAWASSLRFWASACFSEHFCLES